MRLCYLHGLFISCVVVAQIVIEHTLARMLSLAGRNDLERASFQKRGRSGPAPMARSSAATRTERHRAGRRETAPFLRPRPDQRGPGGLLVTCPCHRSPTPGLESSLQCPPAAVALRAYSGSSIRTRTRS
jgi:hypothetical protein